jgi:hypothetical protein
MVEMPGALVTGLGTAAWPDQSAASAGEDKMEMTAMAAYVRMIVSGDHRPDRHARSHPMPRIRNRDGIASVKATAATE